MRVLSLILAIGIGTVGCQYFRAAEKPADHPSRFVNLGPQLATRTIQAAAFTKEPDGRDIVCVVVRSQPAAKLLVVDVKTGAVRRTLPLSGANGAWSAVTASDGSVYVGTEAGGELSRYVPGETEARDRALGRIAEPRVYDDFINPAEEFGAQALTHAHEHRAFDRSERCVLLPHPFLGTDV